MEYHIGDVFFWPCRQRQTELPSSATHLLPNPLPIVGGRHNISRVKAMVVLTTTASSPGLVGHKDVRFADFAFLVNKWCILLDNDS